MNIAFEQSKIGGIILKNKIIRAATHEGLADESGCPTPNILKLYEKIAKGEPGAIITGFAGIQPNGKSALHGQLMIHDDSFIDKYREITNLVHKYDIPIFLQIAHSGRQTRVKSIKQTPLAPSPLKDWYYNEIVPKEMSNDEIEEVINNFVLAIQRAKDANFDGVEIHAAHGYLLCEFLSGYTNRRVDKWGGKLENRYRILSEIITRSRKKLEDFPILVKLNAYDSQKKGMRVEETCKIAQMLEEDGATAIELSCGIIEEGFNITRAPKLPIDAILNFSYKYKNSSRFVKALLPYLAPFLTKIYKPIYNYNVDASQCVKKHVNIPVIVVGGIKNIYDIKDILNEKKADFVSMCRAFITEPNIVKNFKEGKQADAKCIRCNYCTILQDENPLRCYFGKLPN